ncbi:16S rRNA (cytosine(1402)-N(4))-methyltransferase RsmH [Paracoccaceae bacterium]|nr:16S rRNA (cytosine(1402)-N(4))-methyltransferase RsmH [Paracoccaceae bacterium]
MPIINLISPVSGSWLDGTFGAGGYTRALLEAGADNVISIDRDPHVFDLAKEWIGNYANRIQLHNDKFSNLGNYGSSFDGIVLDLGLSSMQIDEPSRGFSFIKDGPLDMRMSGSGPSAADLVNNLAQSEIANILYFFGEERSSRRIANAIVKRRTEKPFRSTLDLSNVIENCLPRKKPGTSHPATRSFQALRIATNDEFTELYKALFAAEKALRCGGILAIVTFHSLEDRIVKRFLQLRSGSAGNSNRYAPELKSEEKHFEILNRKAIVAPDPELLQNPRSRSAKLRIAKRLSSEPGPNLLPSQLGVPLLEGEHNA